MRTLLTLALLATATMAEAAWPCKQAVIFKAEDCKPCEVLIADREKCKAVVSTAEYVIVLLLIHREETGHKPPTDIRFTVLDQRKSWQCRPTVRRESE